MTTRVSPSSPATSPRVFSVASLSTVGSLAVAVLVASLTLGASAATRTVSSGARAGTSARAQARFPSPQLGVPAAMPVNHGSSQRAKVRSETPAPGSAAAAAKAPVADAKRSGRAMSRAH